MKGALAGQQSNGGLSLLDSIQPFLDEIPIYDLEHVFHHRVGRIPWSLEHDED
jgi:hypothetical protein